MIAPLFYDELEYRIVKDGDATARYLINRHYSRIKHGNRNSAQFCAAGENLVILGVHGDWLFIWRKAKYRRDKQQGVECFAFRNESSALSSRIIILCETIAESVWGAQRFFTYVDPSEVQSTNPGYCYQKAGYTLSPTPTKRGLRLLYKEPV